MQLVAPTVEPAWFDPDELRARAVARHGKAGALCPECQVWRWLPLAYDELPPARPAASWAGYDIMASPEWFGDGAQSHREILVRRALANLVVSASPKDFKIQEAS